MKGKMLIIAILAVNWKMFDVRTLVVSLTLSNLILIFPKQIKGRKVMSQKIRLRMGTGNIFTYGTNLMRLVL